jgi:ribonucleoside-diphosphate reductase alpha chain
MTSYTRRRKVTDNEKYDFQDDMGDKWEENKVYHPKLKTFIEITGKKEEESPYIGCSANELDWKKRVDMQSICQKFTTHSISSTINLKQDVPESLIDEIYMRSWEKGLKGVTVYREGSRSGVLVSNDKKSVDDIIKENNAPRRPKNMECDVMRFTNKGERWIGFVGLLNGVPYEAFTGLLDAFPVPGYVEKGVVRKTKDDEGVSRYDFIYKDKDGYEMMMGGLSRAFNREYWNYGKLVSAILRHGMPIPNIINTLDSLNIGDGDTIGTWKAGVKRMLKRYIKDGVKVGETCPNCGKDTLIYQNGCVQCTNIDCTYSKCE